jgi:dTDP-4-amino-4,6-dideoxygalactose transaminase
MVTTDDAETADRLRSLRDYGRSGRETLAQEGMNSRLDELQAAILRIKLRHLDRWNEERSRLAGAYNAALGDLPLDLPIVRDRRGHVYHLFVIGVDDRDELGSSLAESGIASQVHYPVAAHMQPAFAHLGYRRGDFPRSEEAADRVISLPLYPGLADRDVETVAGGVRAFLERGV